MHGLYTIGVRYNDRPQFVLHGLTPRAVLAGQVPDPTMFDAQIAEAREEKKLANRANLCGRLASER